MFRLLLGFLALGLSASGHGAEEHTSHFAMRVSIDDNGLVLAVEVLDEAPTRLATLLGERAKRLEFEPARRDGIAVPSRTTVVAEVVFTPAASGRQEARIAGMGTEVAFARRGVVPWPRGAGRDGYSAVVLAELEVRPDGSVDREDSRIVQVAMAQSGVPADEETYQRIFEKAVMRSLGRWEVIPEEVDGEALATRVRVPVRFCQDKGCGGLPTAQHDHQRYRQEPLDARLTLASLKARN